MCWILARRLAESMSKKEGDGAMAGTENSSAQGDISAGNSTNNPTATETPSSNESNCGCLDNNMCFICGVICNGLCLLTTTFPCICMDIFCRFNPSAGPAQSDADAAVSTKDSPVLIRYPHLLMLAMIRGLRVEPHKRGLVFNIVPLVLIGTLIGLAADNQLFYTSGIFKGQMKPGSILLMVFGLITYIFYLVEARCSETHTFLHTQKDLVHMTEYVEKVLNASPVITEHAHCYHTETRTRTVTTRDANGQMHTRTETYTVVITTHTDSFNVAYNWHKDQSSVPDYSCFELSKVKSSKTWTPSETSAHVYQRDVANFQAGHMHCDAARSFHNTIELDGFEPSVLTYLHKNQIPFAVKHGRIVFLVCTLCLMSWVYKVYLSGVAAHLSIGFSKEVSVLPRFQGGIPYATPAIIMRELIVEDQGQPSAPPVAKELPTTDDSKV